MGQGHKDSETHTKTYLFVWAVLLLLTYITVKTAGKDLGSFQNFALIIAMLIATIKGALVSLYFMHLKHDKKMNQVALVSSLVFLFAFVVLTLSDFLTRSTAVPILAKPVKSQRILSLSEMRELSQLRPELVKKGEVAYVQNCATCHGPLGKGDGASSNPPPRNFTSAEGWKNGRAPSEVFYSITNGIPGTSMAAWADKDPEERWALAHYVRSLTPNPPSDTEESRQKIGIQEGAPELQPPPPELPISFAMERLLGE